MGITGLLQSSVAGSVPAASTIFKVSREYDGCLRRLFSVACIGCGKERWVPRHHLVTRKFCSITCKAKNEQRRVAIICAYCKKESLVKSCRIRKSRSSLVFCDRLCKEKAQRVGDTAIAEIQPAHYGDGSSSYRDRAIRDHGAKCNKCGYDEHEEMLDVNHRDGNRKNPKIENLEVLCVWCHAWETRMVQRKNYRQIEQTLMQ